jgi:glutaredoxin
MTLTLYTKPDCHLCDEALKTLREVCAELLAETGMRAGGECLPASVETGMRVGGECLPASVKLLVRDITTDEALHRAYFERIPVVALNGEELFEYFVDAETLRERLRGPSL